LRFGDSATAADSNSASVVEVTLPSMPSLTFSVTPLRVKTNEVVNLYANLPANGRHLQYRFNYGDGKTSEWQDDGKTTYTYSEAKSYEPSVETGVLVDGTVYPLIKSDSRTITVDAVAGEVASPVQVPPEVGPTPSPRWPPDILILICILVVIGLVSFTILGVGGYKIVKWAFTPKPTFVSHMDVGTVTTDHSGATPLIDFELHLDPNMRSGLYGLLPNGPGLIERSHS
jgi:hypothetical protein